MSTKIIIDIDARKIEIFSEPAQGPKSNQVDTRTDKGSVELNVPTKPNKEETRGRRIKELHQRVADYRKANPTVHYREAMKIVGLEMKQTN